MASLSRSRFLGLAVITVATMLPVTAVVPVLQPLIAEAYGVRDLAASSFMSLNMLGALLAAPIVGWLSDRRGWTRRLVVPAALLDAVLWVAMAAAPPFWLLSILRFAEGAAHITVLSLLLAVVSRGADAGDRPARMAAMGGAIVLGVALGAPVGGLLGAADPVLPLQAGAVFMVCVAACAMGLVPAAGFTPRPDGHPALPTVHAPAPLRLPYLFAFVDRLTVGFFVFAFPMYATRLLRLEPDRIGVLLGVFLLPFAMLCYPAGRLGARIGHWRMVLAGSAGYGLVFAAIPWLDRDAVWPAMLAAGVLSAVMFGPTLVLVMVAGDRERRASAMGGFNFAGSLGFLAGPLLAGALLQFVGAEAGELVAQRVTFGVGASAQFLAVAWGLVALRTTRVP